MHHHPVRSVLFIAVASAFAVSWPQVGNSYREVENGSSVRKAAIIGADDRQTLADYAKERGLDPKKTEAAFAATGKINCDGMEFSAQLSGKNNVLTTTAHSFIGKDCNERKRKSCDFLVKADGTEKSFPLALETLKLGACIDKFDTANDWAVVKLIRPAEGIWPYPIVDRSRKVNVWEDIIQVSGHHKNFQHRGDYPKTVQHCQIRGKDNGIFRHDCDTGVWSSGSGQFVRGPRGVQLIAISIAQSASSGLREGADYNFSDDNKPYHYNMSVPLEGDFLAAVKSYIGE